VAFQPRPHIQGGGRLTKTA